MIPPKTAERLAILVRILGILYGIMLFMVGVAEIRSSHILSCAILMALGTMLLLPFRLIRGSSFCGPFRFALGIFSLLSMIAGIVIIWTGIPLAGHQWHGNPSDGYRWTAVVGGVWLCFVPLGNLWVFTWDGKTGFD